MPYVYAAGAILPAVAAGANIQHIQLWVLSLHIRRPGRHSPATGCPHGVPAPGGAVWNCSHAKYCVRYRTPGRLDALMPAHRQALNVHLCCRCCERALRRQQRVARPFRGCCPCQRLTAVCSSLPWTAASRSSCQSPAKAVSSSLVRWHAGLAVAHVLRAAHQITRSLVCMYVSIQDTSISMHTGTALLERLVHFRSKPFDLLAEPLARMEVCLCVHTPPLTLHTNQLHITECLQCSAWARSLQSLCTCRCGKSGSSSISCWPACIMPSLMVGRCPSCNASYLRHTQLP